MATNVSNNIIQLTRGDSVRYPLFINAGSDMNIVRYELHDNDRVYFALMEPNQPFECALVKQIYSKDDLNDYGDIVIKLTPDDTAALIPGKYYYQIKLRKYIAENDYEVITVIDKTEFWIQE